MITPSVLKFDPEVSRFFDLELTRQQQQVELIASENIVSQAVLEAQGSVLTNKYAEGYPQKRYYGGCDFVDQIENLALSRLKKLYNCKFANVQPHSGSQANQAVFLALLNPFDTIMGMSLSSGGHLTHGSRVNMSGKWFNAVEYGIDPKTHYIDYNHVHDLAKLHKPKLIIAGGSAYSRIIDFKIFRQIADDVGAYLMIDMAHFSGLVAAGEYPSPIPFADVVTSTTHKTLRGPRGGIILTNHENISKKINPALFPGLQGGPLMHIIAAKAVAFYEALQEDFKIYIKNVIDNAKAMENVFRSNAFDLVSKGTDTHLILIDLRKLNITGQKLCSLLEETNITCNKNSVPHDQQPPTITSGIRIGTPAITTRGFEKKQCEEVAHMIIDVANSCHAKNQESTLKIVKEKTRDICLKFPIYEKIKYL